MACAVRRLRAFLLNPHTMSARRAKNINPPATATPAIAPVEREDDGPAVEGAEVAESEDGDKLLEEDDVVVAM